jgi:FkbM family methyltransferase
MNPLNYTGRLIKEIAIVNKILPTDQFYHWLLGILESLPDLVREKSLGAVDIKFGDSFEVNWQGQKLKFNSLSFGVVREIYGHCCYANPGELEGSKHILDLGGNGGAFTLFALAEAPNAKVHAVEAQGDLIEILKHNVQQNGYLDRLTTETAIVGGIYNSWTKEQKKKNPDIDIFDIREYLNRVGYCDFIKCDVEGAEFLLFDENLDWTQAVKTMVLEYHPVWGSPEKLKTDLEESGFQVRQVDHGCLGYFYCSRV